MGEAVQPAPAARRVHYERRRPEDTVLYQLVQEHLETFLAQVEAETGAGLPEFVKAEFEAFLQCGILAHGFLRLRCADCAHEKLVAFSCKRRGFCPSCGARRMVETAAYLVDHLIPRVPVRQWVLSFPIPLRVLFASHPELLTPVLQIVHRVISGFLIKQAGLGDPSDGDPEPIAQRIRNHGVLIISCYISSSDVQAPRQLVSVPARGWQEGARRLFRTASEVDMQSPITAHLLRNGWSIAPGARYFFQANHSELVAQFVETAFSPMEGRDLLPKGV